MHKRLCSLCVLGFTVGTKIQMSIIGLDRGSLQQKCYLLLFSLLDGLAEVSHLFLATPNVD